MIEQKLKTTEQRTKKILLELPKEYLNRFNEFKTKHSDEIMKAFYKSSQHEAFKYVLRDYFRIRGMEYRSLPVEIENGSTDTFLNIDAENKEKLDFLTKKYNISNNKLIRISLINFEKGMEYREKMNKDKEEKKE